MERKKPSLEKPLREESKEENATPPAKPAEKGGPGGPEPTRYGDWERGGKCVDF